MSREKRYFQTKPPACRSGKIPEIRKPLAFPYLRHPATRFRVARTPRPPPNEPTAVASPGPREPDDARMERAGWPIPARRDGGDDDLAGHSIADFGFRIADWGSRRRSGISREPWAKSVCANTRHLPGQPTAPSSRRTPMFIGTGVGTARFGVPVCNRAWVGGGSTFSRALAVPGPVGWPWPGLRRRAHR